MSDRLTQHLQISIPWLSLFPILGIRFFLYFTPYLVKQSIIQAFDQMSMLQITWINLIKTKIIYWVVSKMHPKQELKTSMIHQIFSFDAKWLWIIFLLNTRSFFISTNARQVTLWNSGNKKSKTNYFCTMHATPDMYDGLHGAKINYRTLMTLAWEF